MKQKHKNKKRKKKHGEGECSPPLTWSLPYLPTSETI